MQWLNTDRIARVAFACSLGAAVFAYGIAVGRYQIFPYRFVSAASAAFIEVAGDPFSKLEYLNPAKHDFSGVRIHDSSAVAPGLTLMSGFWAELDWEHGLLLNGGNLLITESQRGRVFEVSPEGSVVWEYVSGWHDPEHVPDLVEAERHEHTPWGTHR